MSQPQSPLSLTPCQQRWLEHLRACEAQGGSLKRYALEHNLSVHAAYAAKGDLKRRGAWPALPVNSSAVTLVPVSVTPPALGECVQIRISLPNGAVIEVLDGARTEHTQAMFQTAFASPL